MDIGIETGRVSAAKFVKKRLLIAAMPNVIADVIGIGQREHDEVMSFAIAERARAGRLGLLVFSFAMNNRRGRFTGVFAHALPHAHHVAASGIDNLAATFLD